MHQPTNTLNIKTAPITTSSLEAFHILIEQRLEYVDSLRELPENWISGHSTIPNEAVIAKSKDFLKKYKSEITRLQIYPPKMLMGPIPDGGISFSFILDEDNKVFFRILNEKAIEADIENEGKYTLQEFDFETNLADILVAKLTKLN